MKSDRSPTTTVSSKGQVVIPKALRDRFGWSDGTVLTVEESGAGVLLQPRRLFPETTLDQVVGCLKYDGPPVSTEEMDAAISQEIRARHDRGRY